MRFTISQKDVETLIRERYNLTSDISVIISRPRKRKPAKIESQDSILNKLNQFVIRPDNKIENIRTLRRLYLDNGIAIDLAPAKYFVENWDLFLSVYKTSRKLPMSYSNGVIA